MTNFPIAVIVTAVVAAVIVAAALSQKPARGQAPKLRPRGLLTPREQAMYNRLRQALPDLHVFAQVSFGALLTAPTTRSRNYFDRKIADFVVCDKALQTVAVIELDDASHRNKLAQDRKRDAMLTGAGYRVIRYPNVPDIGAVQRDFIPKEGN